MIHVLAMITAKPGKLDEVLATFEANVPEVRAEAGCIEYGGAVDLDVFGSVQAKIGPDTFMVIEKWASPEALKAHLETPHMKAFGAATADLVVGTVFHVLTPSH